MTQLVKVLCSECRREVGVIEENLERSSRLVLIRKRQLSRWSMTLGAEMPTSRYTSGDRVSIKDPTHTPDGLDEYPGAFECPRHRPIRVLDLRFDQLAEKVYEARGNRTRTTIVL